jgi:hypothetical protein
MSVHLTWQNFCATIIKPGENRVHRVSNVPLLEIFADHGGKRIGMVVEKGSSKGVDPNLSRLMMLEVESITRSGTPALRVACSRPKLFREAYLFLTAVADRILTDGLEPAEAVEVELRALEALLDAKGGLSIEKQIGLFGELLVLEQMILSGGPSMVAAWTGPMGEAHDFRIQGCEFEVKTTTGGRCIHSINGLNQAVPSSGSSLSFISIQLAKAGQGEGLTLQDQVGRIEKILETHAELNKSFHSLLSDCSYLDEDAPIYSTKWKLRSAMKLVPVDNAFPKINPEVLKSSMGAAFGFLEEVTYKVSFDAIGTLLDKGLAQYISEMNLTPTK